MTGASSDMSAEAKAFLATAPPSAIPGPVSRLTAPLLRRWVDRLSRELLRTARGTFEGEIVNTEIEGVRVTRLTPSSADTTSGSDYAVYVHGSAWMFGHAVDPVVFPLAQHTGLDTYSVEYDLVPNARYPQALGQVISVWNALSHQRDGRGVLIGTSSGGNLALGTLLTLLGSGMPDSSRAPAAVVLLSPWADLTTPTGARLRNEGRDPLIRWHGFLDKTARAYTGHVPASDPFVSPVNGSYRGLTAPVLITSATGDLFAADCRSLHAVLQRDGVPVELDEADGLWHAYQAFLDVPEAQASVKRIAAFVERSLS